jgi:hypothetical protein
MKKTPIPSYVQIEWMNENKQKKNAQTRCAIKENILR